MRRLGIALLLVLTGCSASGDPAATPAPSVTPRPVEAPVTVQTLPADPASWPRLRTRLPRRVPTDGTSLPALLDDPPGRATMVFHPAERWPEPVEGWASETLLFHGRDGQWRRLRMDELGLPDASWTTHDTYGSGSLSPDGRWWAGKSRAGVILLDLGTGDVDVVDLGTSWVASVEWRADSRSIVVGHGTRPMRTEIVELPSRRRTVLPYDYWQAGFAPDGTQLSLRRAGRDRAELLEWAGDAPVRRAELELAGLGASRDRRPFGVDVTDGRFLTFVQRPPWVTIDLAVVDSDSAEVEARLHLDRQDRQFFRDATWLDRETVLLEADPGLIAWRPHDGEFHRVTVVPTPRDGYATLDVATDVR